MQIIASLCHRIFSKKAIALMMAALCQSPCLWAQNPHPGTATIRASFNQYDPQRYNLLVGQQQVELARKDQQQTFLQSQWHVHTTQETSKDDTTVTDYRITFTCIGGKFDHGSISVEIDFDGWSEENYVLLPAAAYNGNRFAWRRLRYSPKLHDIKDIGYDKPMLVSDVPKLSHDGGVSRIQERSGSMSTPAAGFYSQGLKKVVWMLTEQGNQLGDYGISLEESRDRSRFTMTITSPVVREQYAYVICDARQPSWDNPANFRAGDSVSFHFRLYTSSATRLQTLFDRFSEIRKDLASTEMVVNTLPFSECMRTLEQKFNKQNFVPNPGYYSVGMRENFLQDWQIGWTGGMISTLPLLFAGSEQTRQHVISNFDWLFPKGISPSGFYWDAGQHGTEWFGGDIRNMHTKNWHLIRKSGDAVWYITRQFMLMEKMHIPVKQTWKDGNQRVCDAFVRLWEKYHQLGQFVDSQTGDIIVGGSSSGAIVPGALALAAGYYGQPAYLSAAKEMAGYYYRQFVAKGITCGGPGDALQNPDSESSAALVESFVTLYETTGDTMWLSYAEDAARQFATWVVSYNYRYKDTTAFYKAKIRTTGSVYANTQNKHAAPGICTGSGIGLFKLYRYTGNIFYLQLLYDIAHSMPQYLPHPLKPLGNAPVGWVSERVNMTDWEGPQSIGYILPISTWAETSLMLTAVEIPGLYVVPDSSFFIAFDNIEAKVAKDTKNTLHLWLTNPTPADATVNVFEENEAERKSILGENAFYGKRTIHIKAGESVQVAFSKSKKR